MPGYDNTGPEGVGPNGRRLGPCSTDEGSPRRSFFGLGFRRQRGGGGGRGFRWAGRFLGSEKENLKSEKEWLNQRLDSIDQRLGELKED